MSAQPSELFARLIDLFGNPSTADPTKLYGNLIVNPDGSVKIGTNLIFPDGSNQSVAAEGRNVIINGNFDVWQRGTSYTANTTNHQYLADRWAVNCTGSSKAVSLQNFTVGQTSVPYEPANFHRTVVTSVAGSSNFVDLQQLIENVRTFAGQTVTLSFWAKADANRNMTVELSQSFGTGGTPSSSVTNIGTTTCALTTSWNKFTITIAIPSISGKTIGTNGDSCLALLFWYDAGSSFNSRTNSLGQQSGTFDLAQVQLEYGSVATPFELLPIDRVVRACYRYYIYLNLIVGTNISDGTNQAQLWFPVVMRAQPTVTTVNGNGASWLAMGPEGIRANANAAAFGGAQVQCSAEL